MKELGMWRERDVGMKYLSDAGASVIDFDVVSLILFVATGFRPFVHVALKPHQLGN